MRPYVAPRPLSTGKEKPSDELRIGITFRRPQDGLGPTKIQTRLSAASVMSFVPEAYDVDLALQELHRRGFVTTRRGRLLAPNSSAARSRKRVRGPRRSFRDQHL